MTVKKSVPIIAFALLVTGCSTLVQKSGEVLDGSAFADKTLALYRSVGTSSGGQEKKPEITLRKIVLKNGENAVEISNSEWPTLVLRGSMPSGAGSFELREARFLSSHVNGWNEFTLDLLGNAVFQNPGEVVGQLRINGEVERVQISSGQIRLKSSHLSGNAALTPLRNRRERILALITWMQEQTSLIDRSVSANQVFASQKDFENYWKPLLFPELVSKKLRPPEYSTENAEWVRADSVKWNRTYTENLFPEELWEFRNSGALLRDWEEALPWIYMEFSWNRIIGSFDGINMLIAK